MDNGVHIGILGVGSYVPEGRLTNADLEKLVDTSDSWITTRTGISERRVVSAGQATSDLALAAGAAALQDAGVAPDEVDLIVVGTSTPDHAFPSVACKVQTQLGCARATAFDVNAACAGFLSALQVAEQFIRGGGAARVLVIGADTMSRIVDYSDRTTCILFGDGAGAAVLARGERPGLHATVTHADGAHYDHLYVHGGGSRLDTDLGTSDVAPHDKPHIRMNGRAIFPLAVRAMISVTEEVLAKADRTLAEVDWLVPHQANQRILRAVAEGLGLCEQRVVSTIRDYGNNSAASVPLALDLAIKDGRIKRGDTVLLTAFGGGLAWGGALLTF